MGEKKAVCERHGIAYEASSGCTYCAGLEEDRLRSTTTQCADIEDRPTLPSPSPSSRDQSEEALQHTVYDGDGMFIDDDDLTFFPFA